MKYKILRRILFSVAFVVVIFFVLVLYVQYGIRMHGSCQKCSDADNDLRQLSNDLYLANLDKNYFANLEEFSKDLKNSEVPKIDPWGNKYLYSSFLTNKFQCFVVWSFGSDGVPGGNKEHEKDIFRFGQCKPKDKETSTN